MYIVISSKLLTTVATNLGALQKGGSWEGHPRMRNPETLQRFCNERIPKTVASFPGTQKSWFGAQWLEGVLAISLVRWGWVWVKI